MLTYTDTLRRYRVHPEAKSLSPTKTPCRANTHGLLQRRPVTALTLTYIGKEANSLEDLQTGIIHDETEVLNSYPDPEHDAWQSIWRPLLENMPAKDVVANFPQYAHGRTISLSQVKQWRAGRETPHPKNQAALRAMLEPTHRRRERDS